MEKKFCDTMTYGDLLDFALTKFKYEEFSATETERFLNSKTDISDGANYLVYVGPSEAAFTGLFNQNFIQRQVEYNGNIYEIFNQGRSYWSDTTDFKINALSALNWVHD